MTSFAFILGVLPLVVSSGSGSEMRQAVGVAVFFGMIGVTLFGLVFTPIFYMIVRGLADREGREAGRGVIRGDPVTIRRASFRARTAPRRAGAAVADDVVDASAAHTIG